jgi:predicted PurR-regulated permease PerM
VQALLAPEASREMDSVVVKVNRMLGAYVRGLVTVSVLVGIATALGLTVIGLIFGTRYALLIGLLAAVTYAVPWIGQTATFLTAVFFGYVTAEHGGVLAALCSAAVVIVVNQVGDNLVMPRIVGRQVGLHPLAVLFAIMAGFQLFGLVGLVIAVPVAASIRILLERWIPLKPEEPGKEERGLPAFDFVALGRQVGGSLRSLLGAALPHPPSAPPPAAESARREDPSGET